MRNLQATALSITAHQGQGNLFVLDVEAKRNTEESGTLTFSGFRQVPTPENDHIKDVWTNKPVMLDEVQFPTDTYRPFFFDYESAYQTIRTEQAMRGQTLPLGFESTNNAQGTHQLDLSAPDRIHLAVQSYLHAALRYYESDYDNAAKSALLRTTNFLSTSIQNENIIQSLRDDRFFGYHEVLPVLLSIKLNRSIGFDSRLSVFQVIEAGLRNSHSLPGQRQPFAVLYLSAYRQFRPDVSDKHVDWLNRKMDEVITSIKSRHERYQRCADYDDAIAILFPELRTYLASSFGIIPRQ